MPPALSVAAGNTGHFAEVLVVKGKRTTPQNDKEVSPGTRALEQSSQGCALLANCLPLDFLPMTNKPQSDLSQFPLQFSVIATESNLQ